MKAVLDLTKAITDRQYYNEQFSESDENGNRPEKKILFVAPQLSSKHLYKYILPFFSFYNERVYTAITGLEKYNPTQIADLRTTLNSREIMWADYIVIPFTTQDLTKPYGLYEAIREVNPNCKIVFFVDYNFYELQKDHPNWDLFNEFPNIKEATEKNIMFADKCFTNNAHLSSYLYKKINELANEKYVDVFDSIKVQFGYAITYFIDQEIVLQNVEFELHKPEPVINKEVFIKIAGVADEIKNDDLKAHKEKAKRLSGKAQSPKKVVIKTKKVVAEKKQDKVVVTKGKGVAKKGKSAKSEEPIVETITPPAIEYKKLERKYKIGIICSPNSYGDIQFYNQEYQKINQRYGDNVSLIFLGYDYKEDKVKILDGVNFEYVEQVSVIHYFKQLQNLELDVVFIPLRKNIFNITSETIHKYLECGLFNIPVIVEDMFPYNQIIINERNGFLYKGKENIMSELDKILDNYGVVKASGVQANLDVIRSFTYTPSNIALMYSIYD